jgi:hypothetical protein
MDRLRVVWVALAAVAVTAVVAVFLGLLYGEAGLAVESVSATGETPTNATANCNEVVVRPVDVTVTVDRAPFGPQNPQWWGVGVSVRATVARTAKARQLTVGPGESRSVTVPFTLVRESRSAPSERVDAVVQVVTGNVAVADETVTAAFGPVSAGRNC